MFLDTNDNEAWWLERMMDKANMVTSYKPYWLMSRIDIIIEEEKDIMTFEEIVNTSCLKTTILSVMLI